jgi:hypothetical protein
LTADAVALVGEDFVIELNRLAADLSGRSGAAGRTPTGYAEGGIVEDELDGPGYVRAAAEADTARVRRAHGGDKDEGMAATAKRRKLRERQLQNLKDMYELAIKYRMQGT